jgi:hypothetical protein
VDGLLPAYLSYDARQTARAFYRAITFCVLVAMGAMYDAYVTSGKSLAHTRILARVDASTQCPRTSSLMRGSFSE